MKTASTMHTRKLSYEEYQQTFAAPMLDVTTTAEELVDIWPYVDAVPSAELEGFTLYDVVYVYRNPNELFYHILIATESEEVFLVIIVNLSTKLIIGHYLLNLISLYGLDQ